MKISQVTFASVAGAASLAALFGFCAPASAQSVVPAEDSGASSAFPLTANRNYQIRAGDVISISVFNEPGLSQAAVRVLPGGIIQEPLAGPVRVGGLTPQQAGTAVGHALLKYLRHPEVTVAVAAVAPVDVFVLGNVRTPGKFQLQPGSHLMDAIAAAGGLNPIDGELPDARLSSGDVVQTVSLQNLMHGGDLSLNTPIRNQMTVYIPAPVVFSVEVNGAVDHPGDVQMREGDHLVNAIARAGSSPAASADLNHVVVRHRGLDGKATTQTVNMYDIYRNGDVSKDLVLVKGDSVFVPQGHKNAIDVTSPLTSLLFGLTRL